MRSLFIAYVLLIFFGYLGLHKIYLGRVWMGFFYFITGGFLLIGCFIDLFTLPSQVKLANLLSKSS